ncbi:MAG: hypothetical protein R3E66_24460 [bacterium]
MDKGCVLGRENTDFATALFVFFDEHGLAVAYKLRDPFGMYHQ